MAETLLLGSIPKAEVLVAGPDPRVAAVGGTAVEQLMATDPAAAFEWPAGMTGNRGVTYTPPSGDA